MTQDFDGSGAPLKAEGLVRSDCHCTECNRNFLAELDHSIDGNHVAICPHCKHEHYRTIKGGVVTEERWPADQRPDSNGLPTVKAKRVWKHDVLILQGSSASRFIRDKWLEKMQ